MKSIALCLVLLSLFSCQPLSENISDNDNTAVTNDEKLFDYVREKNKEYENLIKYSDHIIDKNDTERLKVIQIIKEKEKEFFNDVDISWFQDESEKTALELSFSKRYRNILEKIFVILIGEGEEYLKQGQYVQANSSFRQALETDVHNSKASCGLCKSELRMGIRLFNGKGYSKAKYNISRFKKNCKKCPSCKDEYDQYITKIYRKALTYCQSDDMKKSDAQIKKASKYLAWLEYLEPFKKKELDHECKPPDIDMFKIAFLNAVDLFKNGNLNEAQHKLDEAKAYDDCPACPEFKENQKKKFFSEGISAFRNLSEEAFEKNIGYMELSEFIDPDYRQNHTQGYKKLSKMLLAGIVLSRQQQYEAALRNFEEAMLESPSGEASHIPFAREQAQICRNSLYSQLLAKARSSFEKYRTSEFNYPGYEDVIKEFELAEEYANDTREPQNFKAQLKALYLDYHYKKGKDFFYKENCTEAVIHFKLAEKAEHGYKDIIHRLKFLEQICGGN